MATIAFLTSNGDPVLTEDGEVVGGGTTSDTISRKWQRRTPYVHDDIERLFHASLEVAMETGVGDGTTTEPVAQLRWSDDGGHTWSDVRTSRIGAEGEFRRRVLFRRLGQARSRLYEVSGSDPVKTAVIDAYLRIGTGRH